MQMYCNEESTGYVHSKQVDIHTQMALDMQAPSVGSSSSMGWCSVEK